MLYRLIIILALTALSGSTLAVTLDDLGPSSNSSTTSDPGTTNLLQPASPGTLQSGSGSDGNIQQPDEANNLQPAGDRSQIKDFLAGQTEGGQQSPEAEAPSSNLLLIILAPILFLAGFAGSVLNNKRKQRKNKQVHIQPVISGIDQAIDAKFADDVETEPAGDVPDQPVLFPSSTSRKKSKKAKRKR